MPILKKVNIRLTEDYGLFSNEEVNTPQNAVNLMKKELATYDREVLCVINLDSRLRPLNYNIVSVGGTNYTEVNIANVFKSAILSNANAVIMLHNHPSNDPTPSKEDDFITQKLVEAGDLMSIKVLDHVIVGSKDNVYSYNEKNRLNKLESKKIVKEAQHDYKYYIISDWEGFANDNNTMDILSTPEELLEHYTEAKINQRLLNDNERGITIGITDLNSNYDTEILRQKGSENFLTATFAEAKNNDTVLNMFNEIKEKIGFDKVEGIGNNEVKLFNEWEKEKSNLSDSKNRSPVKLSPLRQKIADEFLNSLKQDIIPWSQEWKSARPANAISNTTYKGVNSLWLTFVAEKNSYNDNRWCTFKQANEKGWRIKKGEKGTQIEFWSLYDTKTKKKLNNNEVNILKKELDVDEFQKRIKPISSAYTVFNAKQMTGVPELSYEYKKYNEKELLEYRDNIIKNMKVKFEETGDRACYYYTHDKISIPDINKFTDTYNYMATFLHEAAHASGHKTRLNRSLTGTFGSESYAREELRAELTSAFTSQALVIPKQNELQLLENHKAYIQSWIKVLEESPNELFAAIRDADKMSDYLIEKGEFNLKDLVKEKLESDDLEKRLIKKTIEKSENTTTVSEVDRTNLSQQEAASVRLAIKGKEKNIEVWKNNLCYKIGKEAYEYMQQTGETIEEVIINKSYKSFSNNHLLNDTKNLIIQVFSENNEDIKRLNNLPNADNEKTYEFLSDAAAIKQYYNDKPVYYQTCDGLFKSIKSIDDIINARNQDLTFITNRDGVGFDHIYCKMTEHPAFARNTSYTVKEFNSMMKKEDKLWINNKKEYKSSDKSIIDQIKDPNIIYISNACIKYDIYSDEKVNRETQFIGDGEGGIIDHLKIKYLKSEAMSLEKQIKKDEIDEKLFGEKTMDSINVLKESTKKLTNVETLKTRKEIKINR